MVIPSFRATLAEASFSTRIIETNRPGTSGLSARAASVAKPWPQNRLRRSQPSSSSRPQGWSRGMKPTKPTVSPLSRVLSAYIPIGPSAIATQRRKAATAASRSGTGSGLWRSRVASGSPRKSAHASRSPSDRRWSSRRSVCNAAMRAAKHRSGNTLPAMHRLTKAQARRIAVRAQLLDATRPTDLLSVVRQLTLLQIDPTAAIAPSADLVAWSRLGSSYQPAHLRQAVEVDRTLFERDALVRPIEDLGVHLAGAADWPDYERTRAWLRTNDRFRRDILKRLGQSGPLTSRDIPDTSVVPWKSTGWTHNRNVTQMLEILMMRAEVAIAERVGRERLWDLPERVY